ncbi:MAG: tetratricopeptide repeat protein [Pyrinomonadaceae bacterium]
MSFARILADMKTVRILLLVLGCTFGIGAKTCPETANIPLPPPASSELLQRLASAHSQYQQTPNDADAIIWLGRRTAYTGRYRDAINIFSEGIRKFPKDARMYLHRGHRLISIRCFDDAIKDLQKAVQLIEKPGNKDEVEPDGLPNARDIPTSTLHTNIWYHLGLAQYLTGDFDRARASFMRCYNTAKNDDMRIAAAHWAYMSGRRFAALSTTPKSTGDRIKADLQQLLEGAIKDDLDIIETTITTH